MWRKPTNTQRILVPVDLTDDSLCAVRSALAWSKGRKTQLYLIHVIPPHDGSAQSAEAVAHSPASADGGKTNLAMEEFFLHKVKHQSNIACIVRTGNAAAEILRFAREEGIDLIVLTQGSVSQKGRTGPGNVTDIVLRNATIPVVVVKTEATLRQITESPTSSAVYLKEKNIMRHDEKYLQEIRHRVCAKCIDRTASGLCVASVFEVCAINRFLPEIIDIVLAEPVDDYGEYVSRLRDRVCVVCEGQSPDGRCETREDVECALDRYFPLVVDAIREISLRESYS